MKRKNVWKILIPALAVAAVSAFPAVFLYCRNASEANFSEAAPFLFASVGVGLLLFALLAGFTRRPAKAGFVSALIMLLSLNFAYVEKLMQLILPELKYWHTVPIALVVLLHLVWLFWHFVKEDAARDMTAVLCLAFGGLIVVNGATAMPQLLQRAQIQRQLAAEEKAAESAQEVSAVEGQPNVYLLIFDEYANFPEMEEFYDYDNAPLKEFLEENNFNISYTSHNESIGSYTVQTNMASLDYVVEDSTPVEKKNVLRKNGVLFDIMREHGYNIRILESGDFYGGSMPEGSVGSASAATTMYGENIEMLLCQNTVLYPLFQKSNTQLIQDYNIITNYIIANAEDIQNTFTLAYFDLPHPPFVIDENGNDLKAGEFAGPETWKNKSYYLGQFKYTTKFMLSILEAIVNSDPEAVIMLMSDHGARGTPGVSYVMKTNSLNALYYQGKEQNIEGLSNVNTIRSVMNRLFELNYEMVEVPNQEED